MKRPAVSAVVVAFEMARELPRTVLSLSPPYQRGLEAEDVEIVVVDNGSAEPVPPQRLSSGDAPVRCLSCSARSVSPARAANEGIAAATADLVGLFIDGARIATPGMLRAALDVHAIDPGAVVATLGFHLGDRVQAEAVAAGYDAAAEDALLDRIGWPADGTRLFEISCLAVSSRRGWFGFMPETNGLFLHRDAWAAIGGLDEAFRSPGGGLVNHDLMTRAVTHAGGNVVTLLGEGTFHQVHGGVSTNATTSPWPAFAAEYAAIRARPFAPLRYVSRYYGTMPEAARRFVAGA